MGEMDLMLRLRDHQREQTPPDPPPVAADDQSRFTADAVMRSWVTQVIRRQRGETTGLRAISWSLTGQSSVCCKAPPVLTRKRKTVCATCWQPCEWKSWSAPRSSAGRGDGIKTMVIHETPSRLRDLQQRLRAAEADRFVHAAALIEPRPWGMDTRQWHRDLLCWGCLLQFGPERGIAWARYISAGSDLGDFCPRKFWDHVREARAIVAQRARRCRSRALVAIGDVAA